MTDFQTKLANTLCAELVAGKPTLDELIAMAADHGYRPSLLTRSGHKTQILANLYDQRAAELGLAVRAYRG